MKDDIAETLIGKELGMSTEEAKDEIAQLRYLANAKYDGYQQFEPGRRFMESLALWLRNFDTVKEKRAAYHFVMQRMIYISEMQMAHLVRLLYPQKILPILLDQSSREGSMNLYSRRRIRTSETFGIIRRKSLFFSLSDGARMDMFRRYNELNNDQVSVSVDISKEKLSRMQEKLKEWFDSKRITSEPAFENMFFIDDFSGSGNSILRKEGNKFKGVVARFIEEHFEKDHTLKGLCVNSGVNFYVVTYIGTEQAIKNMTNNLKEYSDDLASRGIYKFGTISVLKPLQILGEDIKVPQPGNTLDADFEDLLQRYYDKRLEDEHTRTGGMDIKHGYAGCALPLVLGHNCPNNSVYLLWAQTEPSSGQKGLRGLFPRISRYQEQR